ncbi:MAG: DUF554 domain-containing protein [Treponema sp.]|nr:DUF554 domain-containing protein [Treponema sp.]
MLAVFVNCGAVILGSILGILFAKKFTQELSDMIQTACGVVSSIIGLQMAFKYGSIIYLALSLIIGGVIGYALDIDGAVLKLGEKLEVLTKRKEKTVLPEKTEASTKSTEPIKSSVPAHSNFAYAFLNSSVLFCVGAMAIVGSFEAGVNHNYTTIFTKSILDGFMAIGFTAAMGIGTAFSALAILIYQGALTLLSIWLKPFVSELLIQEVSACGGAIIVMIGINLLGIKKIKTANFLPALVIEILFVIFVPMIKGLFV